MDERVSKVLKVWAALVFGGVILTACGTMAYVNSDLYSGRLNVFCDVRMESPMNTSVFYLKVDGRTAAEGYVDYYNYYGSTSVFFESVNVRAEKEHEVWVESASGMKSNVVQFFIELGGEKTVNLTIGPSNISRVTISVELENRLNINNMTMELYVDGQLKDSQTIFYEPMYWHFVIYLEKNRSYSIEARVDGHHASQVLTAVDDDQFIYLIINS
jgi:hypothetical protein